MYENAQSFLTLCEKCIELAFRTQSFAIGKIVLRIVSVIDSVFESLIAAVIDNLIVWEIGFFF